MKDKRGRGRKTRLSKEKLEDIKNTILTTTPEDFGYNTSTWNGPILRDYLKKCTKLNINTLKFITYYKNLDLVTKKENLNILQQTKLKEKNLTPN